MADGVRLYTITEPTDAVLTLAFRPGTRQLAAGGQDKRIRVWEIGDTAARSIRSAPAHRSAVLRVAFSADGRIAGLDRHRQGREDVGCGDRPAAAGAVAAERLGAGAGLQPRRPPAGRGSLRRQRQHLRYGVGAIPCSNRSPTTRWHDDEDTDTRGRPECSDDRRMPSLRAGRRADAAGRGDEPHALRHPARHDRDLHRRRRESDGRRRGDLHGPRPVGQIVDYEDLGADIRVRQTGETGAIIQDRAQKGRLTSTITAGAGVPLGRHGFRVRTPLGTTSFIALWVGEDPETSEQRAQRPGR